MTSERIVTLTILTACIYALSVYMQSGTWIFPLGLYKVGLFVAIIIMFIAAKQRLRLTEYLALGWSALLLLTSRFFWEFLISEERMYGFANSLVTDFLFIAFGIVFIGWSVRVSLEIRRQALKIVGLIAAIAFPVFLLTNGFVWSILPLLLWIACLFFDTGKKSVHFSIALLFAFLFVSAWLTGAYLGGMNVLANL